MKWGKVAMVICGALVVTALGIDASDTLTGRSGTMLGQLVGSTATEGVCPEGMIQVQAPTTFTCVDIYEASPGDSCAAINSRNPISFGEILADVSCSATSVSDSVPWRYVTREQAALACARSGKRLPTVQEWYQVALGTPDDENLCNIATGELSESGTFSECISAAGIYDAVGNVWEWTTADVFNATYDGRPLPMEGFVTQVDSFGVAVATANKKNDFTNDYFWSEPEGVFGMIRGGFYGSHEDAGVYAVQAATKPSTLGAAIGFRCVK